MIRTSRLCWKCLVWARRALVVVQYAGVGGCVATTFTFCLAGVDVGLSATAPSLFLACGLTATAILWSTDESARRFRRRYERA